MPSTQEALDRFIEVFNSLDKKSLYRLDEIYAENILFQDPLHNVAGLSALKDYFAGMYEGTIESKFDIEERVRDEQQAAISWTMTMRHKKLRHGAPVVVHGSTFLQFNDVGLAVRHRDYFDLGEMLYENIPMLSAAIRAIKRRI